MSYYVSYKICHVILSRVILYHALPYCAIFYYLIYLSSTAYYIVHQRYLYMYIYISIPTYIHTFIHSFIHSFKHTYIHSYIHMYAHTYIYVAEPEHDSRPKQWLHSVRRPPPEVRHGQGIRERPLRPRHRRSRDDAFRPGTWPVPREILTPQGRCNVCK